MTFENITQYNINIMTQPCSILKTNVIRHTFKFHFIEKTYEIQQEWIIKNEFIKDTLIDEYLCGNNKSANGSISLLYTHKLFKFMIPLIREGKLIKPHKKILCHELSSLISHLSHNNTTWVKYGKIVQYGAMDTFGRKLSMTEFTFEDIPYVDSYDIKKSKEKKLETIKKIDPLNSLYDNIIIDSQHYLDTLYLDYYSCNKVIKKIGIPVHAYTNNNFETNQDYVDYIITMSQDKINKFRGY